jgi:glycosyltransferase 2 family protein
MLISTFFSNFLPSQIGGDVLRGAYIAPYFRSRAKAYASVALQRSLGLLGTFAVAVGSIVLLVPASRLPFLVIFTVLLLVCIAGFRSAGLMASHLEKLTKQKHNKITWFGKLVHAGAKLGISMLSYRHHKILIAVVFGMSCIINVQGVFVYVLSAYALNIDITLPAAILASSVTQLSAIIPITPGGLGTTEGAFVLTGSSVGIAPEAALAVAVLVRVISLFCSALGGILYLLHPLPSFKQYRQSQQ